MKRVVAVAVVVLMLALVVGWGSGGIGFAVRYVQARYGPKASVEDRLRQYEKDVAHRLRRVLEAKEFSYPLKEFALVAIKDESILQLFGFSSNSPVLVKEYPILAKSGKLGPKLREGDGQIPEGIYKPTFLNPNSLYHLSIRLNYPNEFDRKRAQRDGRTKLGGDIMIHGKDVSIGCIAIGDPGIEELFCLAARAGLERVKVIIAPTDWRKRPYSEAAISGPAWLPELYGTLNAELQKFHSR